MSKQNDKTALVMAWILLATAVLLTNLANAQSITAQFVLPNGTAIDKLVYDKVLPYNTTRVVTITLANNTTVNMTNPRYFPYNASKFGYAINGSRSYKDNSLRNPDVYLKVCGLNSSYIGDYVDIDYASESGNKTISILTLKPRITSIFQDNATGENCTMLDIDISAFKALYPAYPFFELLKPVNVTRQENVTQVVNGTNVTTTVNITRTEIHRLMISKMNQSLNGSYLLGVDIDPINSITYLTVKKIYDDLGDEIANVSGPFLIMSIVRGNTSQAEAVTRPKNKTGFNYMFGGTERVYVNGILSLKVKVVPPCSTINETGYYYILNKSSWNNNKTCLKVENVSDIVVDFAQNVIDGDANQSYDNNTCAIIINNVTDVTIKGVRAQQFARGICVYNSKNAKIYGDEAVSNINGIYVKNSTVDVIDMYLKNNASEIYAEDNGRLGLQFVHFATANVSGNATDVKLKNVFNPPPDPVERINKTTTAKLVNISQWINVSKVDAYSWIKGLTFHFEFPNPQGVVPKVIYKFEYNCTTHTVNNTTVSQCQYDNGTKMEPVYVDIDKKIIFLDANYTNFSIFAPYGVQLNHTVPRPKPTPTPTPTPTPAGGGGGGGGGGAIPTGNQFATSPPKLNLTIFPKQITLQQGETGEVNFSVYNFGNMTAGNVSVIAKVRPGWKASYGWFDTINPGETKNGTMYISVYDNEIPMSYLVPIELVENATGNVIAIRLLNVTVVPRQKIKRFEILEIPPVVTLPPGGEESVAILVKNNGDYDLHGIKLHIDFGDKCVEKVTGSYDLKKGEKKSLVYKIKAKETEGTCKTIFTLKSNEGVVAFAPVIVRVKQLQAAGVFHILPWLLLIWTIITIGVFVRRAITGRGRR